MNIAFVTISGNDGTAVLGNAAMPFATIQAAVNALNLVGGGDVMIDFGSYAHPTTCYPNIRFIGAGVPKYNWVVTQTGKNTITYTNPTALVGGTILKGGLDIRDCENAGVFNLGIDVGKDYVDGGGSASDGLDLQRSTGITDDDDTTFTAYQPIKGCEVKDVIILLNSPTATFHGMLVQGTIDPKVENVTVWGGVHGFAIKTIGGNFKNLQTFENSVDGIVIKCNNYALCSKVLVNGFRYTGYSTDPSSGGIYIHNKCDASALSDITIENAVVEGATKTFDATSTFSQAITRLTLKSIKGSGTFNNTSLAATRTLEDCWNGSTPVTS